MVACAKLRGSVAGLGRGAFVCIKRSRSVPMPSHGGLRGDFGAVLQECALGDFWALE